MREDIVPTPARDTPTRAGRYRRTSVLAIMSLVVTIVPWVVETRPEIRTASVEVVPGSIGSPFVFSMLGITWPSVTDEPDEVMVRTSRDGLNWTPWRDLVVDHEEGPDDGRLAGTAPLWVGGARFAQVVMAPGTPRGAKVVFVDPGPDPVSLLPEAAASPGTPSVVSRRGWGADESLRRGAPRFASSLKLGFVHHTATGNGYTASDAPRIVRSIYAYHVQGRGWNDIGYNALVDRFGRIYEGRAGGLDRPVIGAHAKGFNAGSFGVSVIGSHDSTGVSSAARSALTRILSWKLDLHHIDPTRTVEVRSGGSNRYPAGTVARLKAISGHRDVGHTSCPGRALYESLGSLRSAVRDHGSPKIVLPRSSEPAFTPNGDGLHDSVVVAAELTGSAKWKAEVIGFNGKLYRTFTGSGRSIWLRWRGTDAAGAAVPHGTYVVRLKAWNRVSHARPADVRVALWAWPDGTVLRTSGGFYLLEDGRLRPFSGRSAQRSRIPTDEAIRVSDAITQTYPVGRAVGFRDGALVRAGGRTWLVSAGHRRPLSSATFREMGFDERAVLAARTSELAPHPPGPPPEPGLAHPDGVALRGAALPLAWRLNGAVRTFVSDTAFASYALRRVDAVGPADAEILAGPQGPVLGFRDGTLLRGPSSPKVYVVSDGLRRWISSKDRFVQLGYRSANIRDVSDAELVVHAEGRPL